MKNVAGPQRVIWLAAGWWFLSILWGAPASLASAISISSPANNATVSGTVSIVNTIGTGVIWIDVDIDSHFFAASPPFTVPWDTTKVGNGVHTITSFAFNNSGQLGSASISVTVNNTGSGGTSYYVAPTGSDSNSGTSPSAAWQTLKRVNSANLQPGDTVSFQAGQTWRGTLQPPRGGVAGAPITFTSFGSGNPPVISGADVVSGWNPAGGSIYVAPDSATTGNVFVDGGPGWGLTAASSVSAMTAGSWYWDSGAKLLYVWLPDGSNPSSHTLEAATRQYGSFVNSGTCGNFSYITINGLAFQRSYGFGVYFHCYGGSTPLSGVVIENNTVTQTGTGQVDGGQYYNGIMFLQEPPYSNAAPLIQNNTISYTGGHGNGINLQGANNAQIVNNNVSYWNHDGVDVKDADGVLVYGNTAHDHMANGAALYAEQAQGRFQRNIIYNARNGIQVSTGANVSIVNTSIYNAGTGIYYGPNPTALVAENNAASGTQVAFGTDGSPGWSEDYNDWGANAKFQIGSGTVLYTLAQWQQRTSDPHDLAANPMFTSPPANMTLLQGSPCVNSGTDVGLLYWGSAPDMGAIESF